MASQSMFTGCGAGGAGSHNSGEGDREAGAGATGGRGTGATVATGRPGRVSEDRGNSILKRRRTVVSTGMPSSPLVCWATLTNGLPISIIKTTGLIVDQPSQHASPSCPLLGTVLKWLTPSNFPRWRGSVIIFLVIIIFAPLERLIWRCALGCLHALFIRVDKLARALSCLCDDAPFNRHASPFVSLVAPDPLGSAS